MAAAPTNPPIAGLGTAQPSLHYYRDYFSDPRTDVFQGNYAAALQPYGVPLANQNVPTPARVQELALSCQNQNVPSAFLLMLDDGKLHVFLQLAKFSARMGLPATPWDDQMYAQKGELYYNQAQTVTWLPDYFNQVRGQLRVGTSAAIDTALAGDPNANHLGPYIATDADTECIRYRRTCYVPPVYVPLFLAGPMTPREAWFTVKAQIDTDNNAAHCAPLVDYLRASITLTTLNAPPALSLGVNPIAPVSDMELMTHRRRILEKDFPMLNVSQSNIQSSQIATQLGVLIQDNRQSQLIAEQRRLASKMKPLSQLIGTRGVANLLLYCNVASENQLPPIWNELANTGKGQQLSVLQFAVDDQKRQCAEPEIQFILSPNILQLVKNLAFEMTSMMSVTTGLTPFLFFEQMEQEAYEAVTTWDALMSGTAAASTSDLSPLLKTKVKPPVSDMDVRHMHRRLEIIGAVLFGINHDIPKAIDNFLTKYLSMESTVNRLGMQMRQPAKLRCTMICRKSSLVISSWFKKRRLVAGPIAGPDLVRFFEDVELDNNWEQTVPPAILMQLGLQNGHTIGGGAAAVPGGGTVGGGTPAVGAGGAPAGGAPGGGNPGGGAGIVAQRINNVNFVSSLFQEFRDMTAVTCKSLKEKIRNNEKPALPASKVDATKSMCLAWHARGECNTRCSCRYDHIPYSSEELGDLRTWCVANFKE